MAKQKPTFEKNKLYWVQDVELPIERYEGIENKLERPILCVDEKGLYVICYRLTTKHNGKKLHNKIHVPALFKVGAKENYIIVNKPLIVSKQVPYTNSKSLNFEEMTTFFDQLRKTRGHWNRYLKVKDNLKRASRSLDALLATFKNLGVPPELTADLILELIFKSGILDGPKPSYFRDFYELARTIFPIEHTQNTSEIEKSKKKAKSK